MFYLKQTFDFSQETKKMLLHYFKNKFNKNFDHAEAIEEERPYKKWMWVHTSVGKELNTFLKNYNCDCSYYGISFFISNTTDFYIGNPHIDSRPDNWHNNHDNYLHSPSSVVKSRFSVMILGNPNDSIYWWQSMPFGDPRLVVNEFKYLNDQKYFSLNIPGSDTTSRWDYLGEPSLEAKDVWSPSAFIKTDCAHTVNCSPGPRLMVTVPLQKSIEDIMSYQSI